MASTETDELSVPYIEAQSRRLWAMALAISRGDEDHALGVVAMWAEYNFEPTWQEIRETLLANPLPKEMVN